MHQRAQLLKQVATERSGLGDGDAVGAGNLDLGIGTGGGGDFAMAVVGQAQSRVAEQVALIGIGLGTVLQVTLQGLTKGTCGLFMQGRQTVDGLFGVSTTTKAWLTLCFLSGHACDPSCLPSWLNTPPLIGVGFIRGQARCYRGQAGVALVTNAITFTPRGSAPYTRPPPAKRLPINASLTSAFPASSSSLACNARAISSVSCRARYCMSPVSANAP